MLHLFILKKRIQHIYMRIYSFTNQNNHHLSKLNRQEDLMFIFIDKNKTKKKETHITELAH